jgi:hypothetical protein
MGRRGRISNRRENSEAEIARQHLGDFKAEGSLGQLMVDQIRPDVVWNKRSLICFAILCSELTGIPFHRDYARNRDLIYKWLSDNHSAIVPFMALIRVA